jgi:hypothetical protein
MTDVVVKMNDQVIRKVENVPLVFWAGNDKQSEKCQGCSNLIDDVFFDMKTRPGLFNEAWGILCPKCAINGIGVGTCGIGLGQRYRRLASGRWLLAEGGN